MEMSRVGKANQMEGEDPELRRMLQSRNRAREVGGVPPRSRTIVEFY
jgi:hypothetical protein